MKSQLESRLGNYDGSILRTVAPVCGEVSQDEIGTAQGIWVLKSADNLYPEDVNIALVHDHVEPGYGLMSIGTSLSGSIYGYKQKFIPQGSGFTNREFSDVTADGNTYCYDLSMSGVVLVKMNSADELEMDYQASASCTDNYSLSSAKVTYIR